MPATVAMSGDAVFLVKDGQLWLGDDPRCVRLSLDVDALLKGAQLSDCDQAPGPNPPSIRLSITLANSESHVVFTALVPDPAPLLDSGTLSPQLFSRVLTAGTPISKISSSRDGVFVSTHDGALYYAEGSGTRRNTHMLIGGADTGGPMADIIAAKNGITTTLSNMVDALPKIVAAIEQRVSQDVLTAFGASIKAQQANLATVFSQPLSSLIQKTPQACTNSVQSALHATGGESADHAVRRLFVNKLEIGSHLDPFQQVKATGAAFPGNSTAAASSPAPAPTLSSMAGSDPLESLGALFAPLSQMVVGANVQSLLGTAVEDMLEAISGPKHVADVLDDIFGIFKIDDTMNALHSIVSGGQCSTLIGQVPLQDYLSKPLENAFFTALYNHYFPGQAFTIQDLIGLMGALFGYVGFAAQGKTSEFEATFSDPQRLAQLTGAPAKLIEAISGTISPVASVAATRAAIAIPQSAGMVADATPVAVGDAAPDAGHIVGACIFSGVLTLAIGTCGVFSFGTGLLASPLTGGIAAGIGQCLGGMIQNEDAKDAGWDFLGGFVGGFTGAMLSTLVGNRLFASWAQNGPTPTARVAKLKMIMFGFTITLGGGGGAIVSSLLKNYAKDQKLVFDDALALTSGAVGGLGGGAMGCGLHFMGGLSGSKCLPIELTYADALPLSVRAILPLAPNPPPTLSRTQPLPGRNPAFPPPVPPDPSATRMGIYRTQYDDATTVPTAGISIAYVQYTNEFLRMDGPPSNSRYINQRQKLFWLEAAAGGGAPAAGRIADLVIGVHGIGRYVFPCLTYRDGGNIVDYTRPMYKDEFVTMLTNDQWVVDHLRGLGRPAIVKLAVCFSALPLGCCSLSQALATGLTAATGQTTTVYGGRPPVYPWLDDTTASPRVPSMGGWIEYNP